MNALVKKEIRLLLPSWIVAMLLAMIQAITRPYDFYVATLLFFGLTIMALTTIGRETSLNTFSLLLSQPAERMRIWQTKLSVLAIAFLIVFGVWLAAFGIALKNPSVDASDRGGSYNLFITICLIATATFTGGLWTTLLLRQIAGAFWLTLLVPAVLSGFFAVSLSQSESNSAVIAVLCVVFAIYSVGGFLFARWLFFRAQDVGWSGGVIALPEWKFFAARSENAVSTRNRKPIFALIKKEFQLQQASLMGAVGLLALHLGIIVLRKYHHFAKDSAGEVLTSIFWMLWLVIPPVIGSVAVAEERRLGVMEGQLCLPVSRRAQFAIKGFLTLLLGTFLGGVMPMLLEHIATGLGSPNPIFKSESHSGEFGIKLFQVGIVVSTAWLALVSFFASTLARSFLQAVGLAIATFFCCLVFIPVFADGRMMFFDSIPAHSILPLVITVPTLIAGLLWLAYLNFKNFRDGWPLWRRNLLGFAGVLVFIVATTTTLYNRAWEIFKPAEPAHGPAKLSLANPPTLQMVQYRDLLVRLPDGRVWFDHLNNPDVYFNLNSLSSIRRLVFTPKFPQSAGPQQFMGGSNWVSASIGHIDEWTETHSSTNNRVHIVGYLDTVGIQRDGSLWVSEKSDPKIWPADKLTRFGNETNWQQLARSPYFNLILLLKKDGTLWLWGTNHFSWRDWPQKWPGLRAFEPYQAGTNSDWAEIFSKIGGLARKTDGSVWYVWPKNGKGEFARATNFDQIPLQTYSRVGEEWGAYVRPDGTLWTMGEMHGHGYNQPEFQRLQTGTKTNWLAVAVTWQWMVALKSDGTLWQWNRGYRLPTDAYTEPPTRLGIHDDWVAIANTWSGIISLAADGSLWFWPDREAYEYSPMLLRLPKQPQFLGNVFGKAD
jgi:hypothetical protein